MVSTGVSYQSESRKRRWPCELNLGCEVHQILWNEKGRAHVWRSPRMIPTASHISRSYLCKSRCSFKSTEPHILEAMRTVVLGSGVLKMSAAEALFEGNLYSEERVGQAHKEL